MTYEERVQALEAQGMTRSDAQGAVDAEELAHPYEWGALWSEMGERPTEWIPTTEGMYDDMMNCLPPAAIDAGGFLVGEPHHHDAKGAPVFAAFIKRGGRYFASYRTIAQFNRRAI